MKAMILAAGFGTRLFPLTIDRTKPAIPFLGKPLVGYVAEYVAGFGFTDVVVNLHHQPESVKKALGDGSDFGVNIHYTMETPEILGTAGALDNARDLLLDDTFLIVNGKIITDIDLKAALETHKKSGAAATMVLKPNYGHEKFTMIECADGCVKGFGPFPQTGVAYPEIPLMFTGIHILEPEVFEYIPRGVYSDILPVFYRPVIESGGKIGAHVTEDRWFELSTIQRYLDISLAMLEGKNRGVFAGQRCKISRAAEVSDSILWDDVTIEPGARLYRTIVGDGVKIKSGEYFENAAIVRADMVRNAPVPEKSQAGEFVGSNYVVKFI
jgi:NDP-sugar pyrophosphorylase family protein